MRRVDALIAVFVVAQLALPLHYYAGCSDPYDERFAWRMFSPTRMARCQFQFEADGKPVRVGQRFHQAWLRVAERGRRDIVERMAMTLCGDPGIREVKLTMTCVAVDGTTDPIASGGFDLCALGGL